MAVSNFIPRLDLSAALAERDVRKQYWRSVAQNPDILKKALKHLIQKVRQKELKDQNQRPMIPAEVIILVIVHELYYFAGPDHTPSAFMVNMAFTDFHPLMSNLLFQGLDGDNLLSLIQGHFLHILINDEDAAAGLDPNSPEAAIIIGYISGEDIVEGETAATASTTIPVDPSAGPAISLAVAPPPGPSNYTLSTSHVEVVSAAVAFSGLAVIGENLGSSPFSMPPPLAAIHALDSNASNATLPEIEPLGITNLLLGTANLHPAHSSS